MTASFARAFRQAFGLPPHRYLLTAVSSARRGGYSWGTQIAEAVA